MCIETHLLPPSLFGIFKSVPACPDPMLSFLSDPTVFITDFIQRYKFDSEDNSPLDQVLRYLYGLKKLEQLNLNKDTARQALEIVKICDQISKHTAEITNLCSSYPLRTHILKICSPEMSTAEAYTKSTDHRLVHDKNYLTQPENWVAERRVIHESLNTLLSSQTLALSRRINEEKPFCFAIRGNTAVGKNTLAHSDELFKRTLDEEGLLKGQLDPDVLNPFLQVNEEGVSFLTSCQVHSESTSLLRIFEQEFLNQASKVSTVVLKRLSTYEDFEQQVIKNGQAKIFFIDIAQNELSTTIIRLLLRNPFLGKDPIPHLKSLMRGHIDSFKYRARILTAVKKDSNIVAYKLYYDNGNKRQLIAKKEDEIFYIYNHDFFKKSCQAPQLEEELKKLRAPITKQIVKDFSASKIIRSHLKRWVGISFETAIAKHCLGLSPNPTEVDFIQEKKLQKFKSVPPEPFDSVWLKDFPLLIEHIHAEQVLHTKGRDEAGSGIHWTTDKFTSSLNPSFEPEARIQFRLGYFIVPKEDFNFFLNRPSHAFSLKLDDSQYYFFVHPEAYVYFQSWHDKYTWVSPQESLFVATPTSSYRTLIVRQVENTTSFIGLKFPFIIKLGVAPSITDTSRLLDENDICLSLKYNNKLKLFETPTFSSFREVSGINLKSASRLNYHTSRGLCRHSSGIIMREIPDELLCDVNRVYSFSSLISTNGDKNTLKLPLIYNVILATIKNRQGANTVEAIKKLFIEDYFAATEEPIFNQGISLASHGQNLCVSLHPDNSVKSILYRDFEGVQKNEILESYSILYRYYVVIKMLNVLTRWDSDWMPPPPGAPLQRGQKEPIQERSVWFHLSQNLKDHQDVSKLNNLSITYDQHLALLAELDRQFFHRLGKYFYLDRAGLDITKPLPAAESGTVGESKLKAMNQKIWAHKKPVHRANEYLVLCKLYNLSLKYSISLNP